MKHYPVPPIPPAIVEDMRALVDSGLPQQEVIQRMRDAGLHIMDCMKLVKQFYNLSYPDDKILVHYSDAWADMRESYDAFHDRAWAAAKEAGFEEVEEAEKPLQVAS